MITVRCECGEVFHADDRHRGKSIRCRCGRTLAIAASSVPSPDAPRVPADPRTHAPAHRASAPNVSKRRTGSQGGALLALFFVAAAVALFSWSTSDGPTTTATPASTPSFPINSLIPGRDTQTSPGPLCDSQRVVRPPTGAPLGVSRSHKAGLGRLTVSNGTNDDAEVVLTDARSDSSLRAIYVRKNDVGILSHVRHGTYRLKFVFGASWYGRRFCVERRAFEFDDPLYFTEVRHGDSAPYSTFQVTLNPVPEGNASFHSISPSSVEVPMIVER